MSDLLTTLSGLRELTGFLSPALGSGLVLLGLAACILAARTRQQRLAWPAARELRAAGARRRDPLRALALALG